jgi:DNA-binding beta-propeller fold protein YncE
VLWRSILVVALLAACGTAARPASDSLPATSLAPAAPARLLLESDDATRIVDASTGQILATLPGGVVSPAKDLIVRLEAAGSETIVNAVDLEGRATPKLRLDGGYHLPSAYGAAPSGFSPNGKWLVLVSRSGKDSLFSVIDVAKWTVAKTVTLGSRFSFDAIHNDGSAMYLIEHPNPGATAYNVRLYDLRTGYLKPDIIFDKAQVTQYDPSVGLMDGTFHVSVAPKAGDWSYGLYMRPNGTPFVHALNVPGGYAQCILDLAGKWTSTSMFSMAMNGDGSRLYVVDAAMGTVSVINGSTQKVVKRATFAGKRAASDVKIASAVVSRDGSRVYATSTRGIAAIYTPDTSFKGWLADDLAVTSLALSVDGTRLYALADGSVKVLEAVSGRALSDLVPAPNVRAIHVLATP